MPWGRWRKECLLLFTNMALKYGVIALRRRGLEGFLGFSDKLDAFSKNRERGVFLTGILVSVVSGPR